MKDSDFIQGDVPMSKEEIRTLALAKLNLPGAASLLDIGGGTGSISIEAAVSHPELAVYVVERKPEGVDLIAKNAQRFQARNVTIIEGEAPVASFDTRVDRVFIGGSGGRLEEIVSWVGELLSPGGRVVINCVTIETLSSALRLLREGPFKALEGTMVSIGRLKNLGASSFFKPLNPTYILAADRSGEDE